MAVACEPGKRRGVVPLQFRLWSTVDPEYKGENAEIEAIIDSIRAEVERREVLRTHLKKVLLKPSPQLEFAFVGGDG